ncbi:MAG: TIGR02099 family protein [Gammaproteobacteria bacterium]|nr:TIGR02099 family protein [Gammaproteobacteria bacterium]
MISLLTNQLLLWTRRLLFLLLVMTALITVAGRVLLPQVSEYKTDAEQWASELFGRPVSISSLEGEWYRFTPQITMKELVIDGPEQVILVQVKASIDLLATLLSGQPVLDNLDLMGIRLHIRRNPDGALDIAGLRIPEGENAPLPQRIHLHRATILLELPETLKQPLVLNQIDLTLESNGKKHQLDLEFALPWNKASPLKLKANIEGRLKQPDSWQGQIYLSKQIALARLLELVTSDSPYSLIEANPKVTLWGELEQGELTDLRGELFSDGITIDWAPENSTESADTENVGDSHPEKPRNRRFHLDRINGNFHWQKREEGWRLDVDNFQVAHLGRLWPRNKISLVTRKNQVFTAVIDYLNLGDLATLTDQLPRLDDKLIQTVNALSPEGELTDLWINVRQPDGIEKPPIWTVTGDLSRGEIAPWQGIPGTSNLSTSFWVTPDLSVLQLNSKQLSASFPGLFRGPLEASSLTGELRISRQADRKGWRITSHEIRLHNDDISSSSRLDLFVPDDREHSLIMDLQSDYWGGDAGTTHKYLPVGIMPDEVVEWLDRGIVDGKVPSGSVMVRGPLNDFPFIQKPTGRFEVLFDVEDVTLDYQAGWPRVEHVDARVRFLNNSFDLWASGGQILRSEISYAHGRIRELAKTSKSGPMETSPFELQGSARGPLQDGLDFLNQSPLGSEFGEMTSALHTEGDSTLALDLAIPIDDASPLRIEGHLTLDGNRLNLNQIGLPVEQLSGTLHFNQHGISSNALNGQFMGHPVHGSINRPQGKKNITQVLAKGKIDTDRLHQQYPDLDLTRIQGETEWQLALSIPDPDAKHLPLTIKADSTLKGIKIDYPLPIGKSAQSLHPLKLKAVLNRDNKHHLQVNYNQTIDLALALSDSGKDKLAITRASLNLGGGKSKLPGKEQLEIHGKMANLDLSKWESMIPAGEGISIAPPLALIDLKLDSLKTSQLQLNNFSVKMRHHKNRLLGRVSSDIFDGYLSIPDDSATPIKADLDWLSLSHDPERKKAEKDPITHSSLSPRSLPPFDLTTRKLQLNDNNLGYFTIQGRPTKEGYLFDQLTLDGPLIQAAGKATWQGAGSKQKSQLELHLSSDDPGKFLEQAGFSRNITEGAGTLDIDGNWPGNPMDLTLASANGIITMQLGKGQFEEIDPGLGRVFGLLNINALQRRLSLDFSDFLKKGFAFDKIEGDFKLREGDAHSDNFHITGPTANIAIRGRIGLVKEDFDQRIAVTVNISSSVALAGALVGGPLVGAVLYVGQEAVDNPLGTATRTHYRMTGPWKDPQVERYKPGEPPTKESTSTASAPEITKSTDQQRDDILNRLNPESNSTPSRERATTPKPIRKLIELLKPKEQKAGDTTRDGD